MGIKNLFRFTVDEMLRHFKQQMLLGMLSIIATILVGVGIYLKDSSSYNEVICDEILTEGNKGTYYLAAEPGYLSEMSKDFYGEVAAIQGVRNLGTSQFCECRDTVFEDISVRQLMSPYNPEQRKETQMISLSSSVVGLCQVSLKEGKPEAPTEDNVHYLYLGSEIKGIDVGTTYKREIRVMNPDTGDIEEAVQTYIVKGIIEKDQHWIGEDIESSMDIQSYYYSLDYLLLDVSNKVGEGEQCYFAIEDGYDAWQIYEEIQNISMEYGISVYAGTLKNAFDVRSEKNKKISDLIFSLAVVMIISVVCMQVCLQSSDIVCSSKRFGIFYANGVTKNELRIIIMLQSLFKFVITIAFATGISAAIIMYLFGDDKILINHLVFSIRQFVLAKTIVTMFIINAVAYFVPLALLESMPPVKLIRNEN